MAVVKIRISRELISRVTHVVTVTTLVHWPEYKKRIKGSYQGNSVMVDAMKKFAFFSCKRTKMKNLVL